MFLSLFWLSAERNIYWMLNKFKKINPVKLNKKPYNCKGMTALISKSVCYERGLRNILVIFKTYFHS